MLIFRNVSQSLVSMLALNMHQHFYQSSRSGIGRKRHCMWLTSELLAETTSAIYLQSFDDNEIIDIRALVRGKKIRN